MHIGLGPLLIEPTTTEPNCTKGLAPANQTYIYRAKLHQRPCPLLIKPTATEPNYTKDISHIGQCTYTQPSRCATQANRKTYIFKLHRYRHLGPQSTQPPRIYSIDQQQPSDTNHLYIPI